MKIDKTIEIGSTSGVGEEDRDNNSIDMTLFYDFRQSLLALTYDKNLRYERHDLP